LIGSNNLWTFIITISADSGAAMDLRPPDLFQPWINQLPQGAQNFLNSGGWLLAAAFLALVVLFALAWMIRALFRALVGRCIKSSVDSDADYVEDLVRCPMPQGDPGDRRLTVYHMPVRIRLVIMAALGRDAIVDNAAVESLLDQVMPGMSEVARRDRPKIRVWPAQLSHTGFATAFHRRMHKPEPDHVASRWILVGGRAQVGRQPLLIGLALWADDPHTVGRITLDPHQWLDVLRLRKMDG
jgi:hypothetical protein